MDKKEAQHIYANPRGYTKERLLECLSVLNSGEVVVNTTQFEALKDAIKRAEAIQEEVK